MLSDAGLMVMSVPTLRQYVQSSSKSGYYIQANVGAGAPVTLQVSDLAEQILTDNRYDGADTVPTKLVWAMYDVGLLSTGSSDASTSKSADVYSAFTDYGVSARLSDSTRRQLVQYFEENQGSQRLQTRKLRKSLSSDQQDGPSSSTSGTTTPVVDDLRTIWRELLAWLRR